MRKYAINWRSHPTSGMVCDACAARLERYGQTFTRELSVAPPVEPCDECSGTFEIGEDGR